MPNTYCKLYIHLVFAVKFRQSLISASFRGELEKYISGIIRNEKQKMMAIYCMPDHCHIFLSMSPDKAVADVVRVIKSNASKWINEKKFLPTKFEWQNGYGAFSYSQSQIGNVVNYILNQEEHHRVKSFREEYIDLLNRFEVEYDERYVFVDPA